MKKLIPVTIFIALSILVLTNRLLIKTQKSQASAESSKDNILLYEKNFKEVKLTTTSNEKIELSKLKEEYVILNFWASWCVPCLKEFPSLVKLQDQFKMKLKVVGINNDEESQLKLIEKISKQFNFNFVNVADNGNKLTTEIFQLSDIPVTIIFKNGKVIDISKGDRDFQSKETIDLFLK